MKQTRKKSMLYKSMHERIYLMTDKERKKAMREIKKAELRANLANLHAQEAIEREAELRTRFEERRTA